MITGLLEVFVSQQPVLQCPIPPLDVASSHTQITYTPGSAGFAAK